MNEILNNAKPKDVEKKRVTFKDPIPEPRVGKPEGDLQQSPRKILTPRVETAIVDKPLSTVVYKGPTTQSKYSQVLTNIVQRKKTAPNQPPLRMTELAQAILSDTGVATDFANEVFDEESRKLIMYR
jgi:hypothetical protein